MKRLIFGLLLALSQVAFSQDRNDPFSPSGGLEGPNLHALTFWHGKNGKSIRGSFMQEKDGVIHVASDRGGQIFKLDPKNLNAKTLTWFKQAKAHQERKPVKPNPNDPFGGAGKGSKAEFKEIDQKQLDRSRIHPIDPKAYGLKPDQNGTQCFVPFFIWWDQNSNLPIAKGREFDDKAQWIYKELEKRFDRGRYLAGVEEFKECFDSYFKAHYKDEASYSFNRAGIFDPASLPNAVKGSSATVLRLMVYSGNRKQWHIDSTVVDAKDDGSVSLIVFNQEIGAKIVPIPGDEANRLERGQRHWQIEFDPGTPIPVRLQKIRDFRFVVKERSAFFVLTPMVKEKKKPAVDEKK
ncbi:MAG: hypothetical protein ACI9UA_003161 [Pseudoalteromonas tetraodonis]|jgi:hypothetical protein